MSSHETTAIFPMPIISLWYILRFQILKHFVYCASTSNCICDIASNCIFRGQNKTVKRNIFV